LTFSWTFSGHSPQSERKVHSVNFTAQLHNRERGETLGFVSDRVLKNRASRRDPALCGFCKCSHTLEYAALSKTPHALADGLMLVFHHPAKPIYFGQTKR
jgi:hypothetical protein